MKLLKAGMVISAMALGASVAFAAATEPSKLGETSKGKAWLDEKGT